MTIILRFKAKGPGRGWWGPPKGTHGSGEKGKKALDFIKMSKEERQEAIRNLQAGDLLVLFHGTRDPDLAKKLAMEGFDPSKRPEGGRIYSGSLAPEKGFYVSPYRDVSTSFGGYVVEFETTAGNLIAPPEKGLPKGETADDFWRSSYPNSFRPALSASLKMGESQGLLVNPVKGKAKAVWTYSRDARKWVSQTPEEFNAREA